MGEIMNDIFGFLLPLILIVGFASIMVFLFYLWAFTMAKFIAWVDNLFNIP